MKLPREQLERMIAQTVEREGFEFVEVKLGRYGRHNLLRVFAYRDGGITLGECGRLSRAIGRRLDEVDAFESAYTLEVSSPGLDRPLTTLDDFRRTIGEDMLVQLAVPLDNRRQVEGRLVAVREEMLVFETHRGVVELPIDRVKRGKIVF